jgi:AhpD family alkylhydroperoxidase
MLRTDNNRFGNTILDITLILTFNFSKMQERINMNEKGQDVFKLLFSIGGYLKKSKLEESLLLLVVFRVSQINGCAYCLDMHSKDARAKGETEQRLYGLSAWKETPYYSERERAAFAWAEALTCCEVADDVYTHARAQFSEQDLIDLTLAITNINTWNRFNIAFPKGIGTYQVGQFG